MSWKGVKWMKLAQLTSEYRITEDYLTTNPYSRPGIKIAQHKGIVIHWVANAKSSAQANRNYFENRKKGNTGYGSAHEIIDLDGSIIKCIPDYEMSYAVGSSTYTERALQYLSSYPNNCTYNIECTHVDNQGRMTPETFRTLLFRVVELAFKFGLKPHFNQDLWLHQEVVGWKDCHRYFVNHPTTWHYFQQLAGKIYDSVQKGDEYMPLALQKQWQWDLLKQSVQNLMNKGILNNSEWIEKVENQTITLEELTWLNTVSISRIE